MVISCIILQNQVPEEVFISEPEEIVMQAHLSYLTLFNSLKMRQIPINEI